MEKDTEEWQNGELRDKQGEREREGERERKTSPMESDRCCATQTTYRNVNNYGA